MLVNGIDIRKYNAVQLTANFQPPQIVINSEWVEGAPTPHVFETSAQFGTLELEILFRGTGRNAIMRKISEFLSLLTARSKIQVDGYRGTYIGDITSNAVKKTRVATRYFLTLKFNGFLTDDEVTNEYKSARAVKFQTLGTRDAPCIVEIMPQTNLQEYRIGGFGDDEIVLKNLRAGKVVIIDGERGTVTEDGENKFADCDMWAFPVLRKQAENNVTFSSDKCDIKIHYKPMWL